MYTITTKKCITLIFLDRIDKFFIIPKNTNIITENDT